MNFKRNLKKASWHLFLGISLIFIGLYILHLKDIAVIEQKIKPTPLETPTSGAMFAKVIRVVDGDTIEIEGGLRVRYIGIDTTEIYPEVGCYSLEAKKANEQLVLGRTVRLEKDMSETDKYGRFLRYVFIDDKFVNDKLVKDGYAKIESVPPDVKYKSEFLESEKHAKESNLGLWGKCY